MASHSASVNECERVGWVVVFFSSFDSLDLRLTSILQGGDPPFKLDVFPQPHDGVDDPEGGPEPDVYVIVVEQVSEGTDRVIRGFRQGADGLVEHPMP
jgi:hypothetical protein